VIKKIVSGSLHLDLLADKKLSLNQIWRILILDDWYTYDNVLPKMNPPISNDSTTEPKNYVVWRILDGKAGHEAQTLGLLKALEKKANIASFEIKAPSRWKSFSGFIFKYFGPGKSLPPPDLILGAGNRTHLTLLAASHAYGGKTVVLMQPTLPVSLFNLCLIPKHDARKADKKILLTDGVLNPIQPATDADPQRGLFLIGGPSTHYKWDTTKILEQVITLIQENLEIHWTLTTSRRTPTDCTQSLIDLSYPNLKVIPVEKTPKGWVAEKLQECKIVWVSEDSVSMVYEALTAGALTGLLAVPSVKQTSRVQNSVRLLLEQQHIVHFEERNQLFELGNGIILAEADRCADFIINHLLNAKNQI
jgi:mitochondrial fission protein ELM1